MTNTQTFICYSRKDQQIVDQLTEDLKRHDLAVWRDIDSIATSEVPSSKGWRQAIDKALKTCDSMVVVLSPDSVDSQEVEAEWNDFARKKGNLYPIIVRECDPPYRLSVYNIIDMRESYEERIAQLVTRIRIDRAAKSPEDAADSASKSTTPPVEEPKSLPEASTVPRKVWFFLAGVGIVATLIGVSILLSGAGGKPPSGADATSEPLLLPSEMTQAARGVIPPAGNDNVNGLPDTYPNEESGAVAPPTGTNLSDIGTTVWEAAVTGEITRQPAIGLDGTIYLTTAAGTLQAISRDGVPLWQVVLGGVGTFVDYTEPVIAPDGSIYVVFNNELLTYNPDGSLRWSWREAGEWLTSRPAIGADGRAYLMSSKSNLWAVSSSGETLWSQSLCSGYGGGTWPGPAINNAGVVVGVCKGDTVSGVDAETGEVLWQFDTNSRLESTIAAGANGLVFVAGEGGWVYGMNAEGNPVWSTSISGGPSAISIIDAPIVVGPDGTVFVAPRHGTLYALDPDEGTLKWTGEIGGQGVGSRPVAAGPVGEVYAYNLNHQLIRFEPDGAEAWRISLSDASGSPPAVDDSGRLYIGIGSTLYAVDVSG